MKIYKLALLGFSIGLISSCSKVSKKIRVTYPPGRDTIAYFGTGRFSVLRCNKSEFPQKNVFFDGKEQTTIAINVINWKRLKDGQVFLLTQKGEFIILNTVNDELKKYKKENVPSVYRKHYDWLHVNKENVYSDTLLLNKVARKYLSF